MAEHSHTEGGTPGTLLRGEDGTLYFIPDLQLATFRVPEEAVPKTSALLKPIVTSIRATRTTGPSDLCFAIYQSP